MSTLADLILSRFFSKLIDCIYLLYISTNILNKTVVYSSICTFGNYVMHQEGINDVLIKHY